jgi:hypothetical protein
MNPEERLAEIEALMASPDFWSDKDNAQKVVREYQSLKEGGSGRSRCRKRDARHSCRRRRR